MRALLSLEQMTNQPDRWDASYEERNALRQWFRDWAFTEPQRPAGNGATISERQIKQYEEKLLNPDI